MLNTTMLIQASTEPVFQFIPTILFFLVPTLVFSVISTFIFRSYAHNRLIIAAATVILLFGITSSFETVLNHPLTADVFDVTMRVNLIFTTLLQTSLFIVTLIYREHETKQTLLWQRGFLWVGVVPYIFLTAGLLLFTNFYFHEELLVARTYDQFIVYGIPQKDPSIIRVIYQSIMYVLSIYNCYCVHHLTDGDVYKKRSRFLIFIAIVFTSIAGVISSVHHYLEDTGHMSLGHDSIWMIAYRALFLAAVGAFFFGFVKFSALIQVGRDLVKDFFIYLIVVFTLVVLYVLPVYFLLTYLDFPNFVPFLFLFLLLVPLITHSGQEKYLLFLQKLFEPRTVSLDHITLDNIQYVLKNANSEEALSKSALIRLTAVKIESKRQKVQKEIALKKIIHDVLDNLKPEPELLEKRSKATVKYEILRMIIQEQAVESQILWDLGFKSKSILDRDALPRYPILSNSDYTGASVISYKRLRKQAIAEFMWHFESLEKKALRLK